MGAVAAGPSPRFRGKSARTARTLLAAALAACAGLAPITARAEDQAASPAARETPAAAQNPSAAAAPDSGALRPPPTALPAEQLDTAQVDTASPRAVRQADSEDPKPKRPHPHFKSDIWLPLPSVLLPGFGQYFQGDLTGMAYTGVALGGLILVQSAASEIGDSLVDQGLSDPTSASENWSVRKIVLGSLAAQGSGFLSAYSAFRISVPRFQAEDGKYLFLTARESVGDLLSAPARFDHLAKPSTYIPLGLLAGGAAYLALEYRTDHRGSDWTFSGDDLLFSWPMAYNAGVSEEALFRGWLLPLAYQYTGQIWWLANGSQALLFGLAHYGSGNPYPWPQALLGYYFGYLTRKNGWSLSESIFMHSWWDAILFTAQFATMRRVHSGSTAFRFDLPLPF